MRSIAKIDANSMSAKAKQSKVTNIHIQSVNTIYIYMFDECIWSAQCVRSFLFLFYIQHSTRNGFCSDYLVGVGMPARRL